MLPGHLRRLAGLEGAEVEVTVGGAAGPPRAGTPERGARAVTLGAVIDALEASHPALRGLLREPGARLLRPYVRCFAGRRDLTPAGLDTPLPGEVLEGRESLRFVGALAGG